MENPDGHVKSTHNSTRAGFPFPTMLSKLSGVNSTTFEACATANRATVNKDKTSFMLVGKETDGCDVAT
jgi:hypothetical protein